MRNLFLAVAFALGLGFAATGAQAAPVSSNLAGLQSTVKAGNPLVEKTHYQRRYWRHRYYSRHRYSRPWGYSNHRYYRGRHYHHRPYYRHHHRHWR